MSSARFALGFLIAMSAALAASGASPARADADPSESAAQHGSGEHATPTRETETDDGEWRDPDRLLPAAQIGLGLTAVGVGYWARNHPPRVGLSTWSDRFSTTRWLILDASPFRINYLQHAGGGAAFHLAARTSDLGLLEAAVYNLAGSLYWEYVVEYDRKVDLNDLIFTTPAGFALGEFGYALGRLFQQKPSGPRWEAARWTLGLPQSINYPLRGVDGPRGPDVERRFRLSAGMSRAHSTTSDGGDTERSVRTLSQIRLGARLLRLDEPFAPGSRWRGFADGNITSLEAVLTAGGGGDFGHTILSDTFIAGWRYSHIAEERSRGGALTLGSATAFRYQSTRFESWRDRLGAAHLPGLAVDATLWGTRWRLFGLARVHPDYGGIGSLAHARWTAAHPEHIGWTSLGERGYYHALGLSGRLRAELTLPYASAGAELFGGRYRHHHGRDLNESELTVKQRIASRIADYDLWLRARLTETWYAEARLEGRHRAERYEDLDASARMLRAGVDLGASF